MIIKVVNVYCWEYLKKEPAWSGLCNFPTFLYYFSWSWETLLESGQMAEFIVHNDQFKPAYVYKIDNFYQGSTP